MDRSKFKATSTKKLKTLRDEEDKMIGSGDNGQLDTLEIKDGLNKIRIAPKFPNENEFYHLVKRTWVPYEKEDGTRTNIPVLDSKVHGGTKMDIIEEYVKFVKENLDPEADAEALKKLAHWKDGLVPQVFWQSFGWKLVKGEHPEFGIFEFKRTVRDELNSISIIEDEDEALDIDPFTDVDEGLPILLTYNSKAKKSSDYYSVKISKNKCPLTDEMFEELTSQQPMSEKLKGVYTLADFDKALEGIMMYDIDEDINLINEDEFQDIVADVRAQYGSSAKGSDDEDEDEEEEAPKAKKSPAKKKTRAKVEVIEEDEEEDEEEETPAPVEEDEEEDAAPAESDEEEDDEEEAEAEEEAPKAKKKLSVEELRAKLKARKNK